VVVLAIELWDAFYVADGAVLACGGRKLGVRSAVWLAEVRGLTG
jgi:hypothetical protein